MDAQDEERPLIHRLPPQDETTEFTCDGTVDISNQTALKQSTGNWRACFFILGVEFTESVAFFGIAKNLVTYLTGALHESNVDAATAVSTWIGSSFFTPLVGAFMADTFWGRYWTVVIFLSVYVIHVFLSRFFDKAAIVAPYSGGKGDTSPWRLCTVSQVEELKMLLRMFPVWASMVLFFAVTAQMSSTFIEQGAAMDNHIGPFTIPPASLATFDVISVMVCIPIYDAVLVPLARRVTGMDRGLSQLQRLGVGLALSAAGMAYAALVETRRLALARTGTPMSIMWQAPAFAVLGAGEVFTAVGILEFFYDQSPGGMKSLGTALAQLTIAAGNYLSSAVIGAVAAVTTRGGEAGWIPDDLNEGHLDYFFWLMAALGVVNLLHFLYCSMRYRGNNTTAL
ncbi:hypothetical protein HU200_042102 [Digitaria exilis]|uniref:Peptide transporter PTR2 n=1 Tax=Digitaria exilis TaxID=1010633 RepID=A0A835BBL7_9POAL|nr:hypothetical protein HU200_042102 [Digitaria exilis]